MSTLDNLKDAFAGESQANRKYLAFAKKADTDGFPQVGRLFRAAAAAETVHAHAHLRAMDGVQGTEENLKVAIEGEGFEWKEMYPPYLATAVDEGHKKAELSFRYALPVEKTHYELYGEALKAVQGGGDLPADEVYVCEICGHTVVGDAPDKCPVCNAKKERFFKVD